MNKPTWDEKELANKILELLKNSNVYQYHYDEWSVRENARKDLVGWIIRIFTSEIEKAVSQAKRRPLWEIPCSDGKHDSFWKSIVTSPQWKEWEKEVGIRFHKGKDNKVIKGVFDVDECRECGWMSQEHFQEFIGFITEKALAKRTEECAKMVEDYPEKLLSGSPNLATFTLAEAIRERFGR